MTEKFDFKSAVKNGFLHKSDEKYVKDLQKKGWDIEEFNLRSKGFEVIVKKGSNRMTFIDKLPELVLKQAAKKVR